MSDTVDIFRLETRGARWLESAATLECAHVRVRELAMGSPGEYLVLDQTTGDKCAIKPDGVEEPPRRVKVLLADDAEVVRKAIRHLLSECEDISLVGEAATFSETVQKARELSPDEVIFDLRMAEGNSLHLPAGTKLLAISFANDDEAKAMAESIGAAKFIDKMNLTQELIPAILELAPKPVPS